MRNAPRYTPPSLRALAELLGVCALANVPILLFIHYSTRNLYGPAHWMPDGAVAVFHAPPSLFRRAAAPSPYYND